jgi:hypothetical protein
MQRSVRSVGGHNRPNTELNGHCPFRFDEAMKFSCNSGITEPSHVGRGSALRRSAD